LGLAAMPLKQAAVANNNMGFIGVCSVAVLAVSGCLKA
jgi:hypothetical protein